MLRLPMQIEIGPYTFHLNVLAARLQRQRRRIRLAIVATLLLVVIALSAWVLLPLLRGTGIVVVPALPADVRLLLDDRPITSGTYTVASGPHTLRFEQTDAYPAVESLTVNRSATLTVTLPLLRPVPVVQLLPLQHQQSIWTNVSPDASGGWRLTATRAASEPSASAPKPGWGPTTAAVIAPYLLHLDTQGLTRLSVLETYPVADELTVAGQRYWAMWEPQTGAKTPGVAGMLSLTTPVGTRALTTTGALRGVWWAPGGTMLLVALPHDQGLDLAVIDPQAAETTIRPLITVSGTIQQVQWHPDGRAVIVVTALENEVRDNAAAVRPTRASPTPDRDEQAGPLAHNAVLIELPHAGRPAQAQRLRGPPSRPAGLVPLAWTDNALWWVSDTGLGLGLDRVGLGGEINRRIGTLPADLAALTVLPDETIRIIRPIAGALSLQTWPAGESLLTLPSVVPTSAHTPVGGTWRAGELILATSPTALWYVQLKPETVR